MVFNKSEYMDQHPVAIEGEMIWMACCQAGDISKT